MTVTAAIDLPLLRAYGPHAVLDIEATATHAVEFSTIRARSLSVVASSFFCRHLDMSVRRNPILGKGNPVDNLDAGAANRLVFHIAHGDKPIDASNPQPMQDVGHEFLEAHILSPGNAFGTGKVG